MGIGPKNPVNRTLTTQICNQCGESKEISCFAPTKSIFYPNGCLPLCDDCVNKYLDEHEWDWKYVDKICQIADIPFVPKEWVKMQEIAGNEVFHRYAEVFMSSEFEAFGWGEYYQEFLRLREERKLEDQVPEMAERKQKELRKKWDGNYSEEEFDYLEDLLNGMYLTQNINTKLQHDQALKLCKISLEIDSRIREGSDVDKLLGSYEKLIKVANFTPKNSKSASDLESVGELCKWLEAGGWRNKFYDNVTRDVVDETMKNMQAWTQRLYVNETGIGEEVTRRIEALKLADQLEHKDQGDYNLKQDFDLIQHDADSYNELMMDDLEEEEFMPSEFNIGDEDDDE